MNAEKTGQYIRQRRTELGMTQQDLADRLFISTPAILKWENGKSLPDIAILEKLAEVLDTSVEAIMSSEQLSFSSEKHDRFHVGRCRLGYRCFNLDDGLDIDQPY